MRASAIASAVTARAVLIGLAVAGLIAALEACHGAPAGPSAAAQCAAAETAYARGVASVTCPECPAPEPCPAAPEPEPCPECPEPEPCPECDETLNDVQVADDAVAAFVGRVISECSFGPSLYTAATSLDVEIKRRIERLHRYGRCR